LAGLLARPFLSSLPIPMNRNSGVGYSNFAGLTAAGTAPDFPDYSESQDSLFNHFEPIILQMQKLNFV